MLHELETIFKAFKQEKDNKHDRFVVAGQTILPGTLFHSTVGHVPIEVSRHIWHALVCTAESMVSSLFNTRDKVLVLYSSYFNLYIDQHVL